MTEVVGEATGGPSGTPGRTVEDSHRDLRITGTEQEAFTDDLSQSLDKFEIPPLKRSEVLAKVQGTGDAIVAGLQSMTGGALGMPGLTCLAPGPGP